MMLTTVATEHGKLAPAFSEGKPVLLLCCVECGRWGELEPDQADGRTPVQHECGYIDQQDYLALFNAALAVV